MDDDLEQRRKEREERRRQREEERKREEEEEERQREARRREAEERRRQREEQRQREEAEFEAEQERRRQEREAARRQREAEQRALEEELARARAERERERERRAQERLQLEAEEAVSPRRTRERHREDDHDQDQAKEKDGKDTSDVDKAPQAEVVDELEMSPEELAEIERMVNEAEAQADPELTAAEAELRQLEEEEVALAEAELARLEAEVNSLSQTTGIENKEAQVVDELELSPEELAEIERMVQEADTKTEEPTDVVDELDMSPEELAEIERMVQDADAGTGNASAAGAAEARTETATAATAEAVAELNATSARAAEAVEVPEAAPVSEENTVSIDAEDDAFKKQQQADMEREMEEELRQQQEKERDDEEKRKQQLLEKELEREMEEELKRQQNTEEAHERREPESQEAAKAEATMEEPEVEVVDELEMSPEELAEIERLTKEAEAELEAEIAAALAQPASPTEAEADGEAERAQRERAAQKDAFKAKLQGALQAGPRTRTEPDDGATKEDSSASAASSTAPKLLGGGVKKTLQRPGKKAPTKNPLREPPPSTLSTASRGEDAASEAATPVRAARPPPGVHAGGIGGLLNLLTREQAALRASGAGVDARASDAEAKGPIFDPTAVLKQKRASAAADQPPPQRKLIQIRGKRRVDVRRVPCEVRALNEGNVFVLVLPDVQRVFVWHGKACAKFERATALDVATRISRTEYGDVVKLESGQDDAARNDFWEALGGTARDDALIGAAAQGELTPEVEAELAARDTLYVFDASERRYVRVEGRREQAQLKIDRSFVLDCRDEFYLWHGKQVKKDARAVAAAAAEELLASRTDRAPWCHIEQVNQGGEALLFVYKFAAWSAEATLSGSGEARGNVAASDTRTHDARKQDVIKMHAASKPLSAKKYDNGDDGTIYVWRVEGNSKVRVPEELWGQFWSAHNYVVAYNFANGERWLIYNWQGLDSSVADRGTAAGIVIDLNTKLCKNAAAQERIEQNRETRHFLLLWKGHFVVHLGTHDATPHVPRLYQARETFVQDDEPESPRQLLLGTKKPRVIVTRIVEVPCRMRSLCSGDVYALVAAERVVVWRGTGATDNAVRRTKETVARFVSADVPVCDMAEGSEDDAFWSSLEGHGTGEEYQRRALHAGKDVHEAKLFLCDNKMGTFRADRVYEFVQGDLNTHKVAVLDVWERVYLWIGAKSKVEDRKLGGELVLEYIAKARDARPQDTERARYVLEGQEPLEFGHSFPAFRFGAPAESALITELLASYDVRLSYEELKQGRAAGTLPGTIDATRLEDFLSDEEFEKVFGVTRDVWLKRPQWKRLEDKKKAGLY